MKERKRELIPSSYHLVLPYTTAATLQWDTFPFFFFFSIFLVLSRCTISVLSSRCVCSHLTSSFYSFFGTHHGLGNLLSLLSSFPIVFATTTTTVTCPCLFFSLTFCFCCCCGPLSGTFFSLLWTHLPLSLSLSLFFFSASFSLVLYGCC